MPLTPITLRDHPDEPSHSGVNNYHTEINNYRDKDLFNFFEPDAFSLSHLIKRETNKIAAIYIYTTRQNVIMTVVDLNSRKGWLHTIHQKRSFLMATLACFSPGQFKFRGKRKTSPHAVSITTKKLLKMLVDQGFTHLRLVFRGTGSNRETILKTFLGSKYKRYRLPILSVTDVTLSPHNGCRPKNRQRR